MTEETQVRSRARPGAAASPEAETETTSAATATAGGGLARRSRVSVATGASEGDGDTSWMHSGEDGEKQAEAVRQRRAEQDAEAALKPVRPMRFKLSYDMKDANGNSTGIGETADVVILDAKPGPRIWEHRARNPRTGYWTEFEACPHEWDVCPLCPPEGEKAPYYVMFLTVIDMREFTDRENNVWAATRKLLPVKIEQQGFFDNLYKKHGSLRGVHLIMTRDGGRMSAEIGNNIVEDCVHTEEELTKYAKENMLWAEYKQQNGRVIWAEGEFIQPYNYGKVFERPTAQKLRLKYNPGQQGSNIGGRDEQQGEGWRNGTSPGRANGGGLQRSGSQRRVNLDDTPAGGNDMGDDIPF